jgi:hypothetical protein
MMARLLYRKMIAIHQARSAVQELLAVVACRVSRGFTADAIQVLRFTQPILVQYLLGLRVHHAVDQLLRLVVIANCLG